MPQKININGRDYEVDGAKNVLHACLKAGVEVPHYCWHPALSVVASCRLCLLEIGGPDPKDATKVSWQPRLAPSCQTPLVRDGVTYVKTDTPKVRDSQKQVMEFLLINHPLDCPVCDQAGECLLQDFSFKYGNSASRFHENKEKQPKKDLGPTIILFADRCILCSRCVRFEQEISGRESLGIINRGNHCEIDIFPDRPLAHNMSANVGDICPVGALEDKDFLYKQRVWFLRDHPSVCEGCSTGCSTWTDSNPTTGVLWRVRPRANPLVNDYWMCDEGRYGWKYVHASDRLTRPTVRKDPPGTSGVLAATTAAIAASVAPALRTLYTATGTATGTGTSSTTARAVSVTEALEALAPIPTDVRIASGSSVMPLPVYRSTSGTGAPGLGPAEQSRWERYKATRLKPAADWSAILAGVRDGFAHVARRHRPSSIAAVISPFAANEEAYLLARWVRSLGDCKTEAKSDTATTPRLVLGPVPHRGSEERFKSGFTVRPEKCPNRAGVSAVIAGVMGVEPATGASVPGVETLKAALRDESIKALFVFGGYPATDWLDEWTATFRKAEFLVVQDIRAGKLTEAADVVLAGAASVEREGTWINHAGVIQHFDWAFPPPGDARRDGQILAELAGRAGMYNSLDVLTEMAEKLPAFAELKGSNGLLPSEGRKLTLHQEVGSRS